MTGEGRGGGGGGGGAKGPISVFILYNTTSKVGK